MLKRLLLLLAISLLPLAGCDASRVPTSAVTIQIKYQDGVQGMCSATVVGRHTILTATHCFKTNQPAALFIDGQPARVDKVLTDKNDHLLIFVKNMLFDRIAVIDQNNMNVGQEIDFYGNAEGVGMSYRHGFVSRIYFTIRREDCALGCTNYQLHVAPGDSGGGIFKDGKVVGVITGNVEYDDSADFVPSFSRRLLFTDAQLKEILTYGR